MPRRRTTRRKRSTVPKRTQKIRKLAGQAPVTWAETLARSAGPLGKLASSVATIAGLVNAEDKFVDTTVSGTGITNAGTYSQWLTAIQEGDDQSQRNGRNILSKHLQCNFKVVGHASAASTVITLALVMVKAVEPDVITPWPDVFAASTPTALINKNNSENFIILKKFTIQLSNTGSNVALRRVFINLKGIHIRYDGTASTDRDQNNIILLAISDQATNTPSLYADIRYAYYDN